MHNLARPAAEAVLEALQEARAGAPALPGLSPMTYARAHRVFEGRSDQRGLIVEHLRRRFADRAPGPVAVLSVGCGDGTVDAPLATLLADAEPARPVRYVGVDPHGDSTAAFAGALGALGRPSLTVETHTTTFAAARVAGPFDVVTFVHSTYYVADLEATLAAAHALLRPGGELLVVSAPRAGLNAVTALLAPAVAGTSQWFGDDVADAVSACGLPLDGVTRLDARLDLEGADDEVLDFTVQARLTPELRPLVRDYLASISPGPGARDVPHPVDVYRVVRPGSRTPEA